MKKFSLILIVVFLISAGAFSQQVTTSEKTKEEQEKELQLLQTIELQKKAMADQKKVQDEAAQALKDQKAVMDDAVRNVRVEVQGAPRQGGPDRSSGQRTVRAYSFDEPFVFTAPGMEVFYGHSAGGDSERTTWDFSKSIKENSFKRDYSFDVENTVNTVVMSIMGDCKAGEIRIGIVMPNGKKYSDILIDEFGNLNWRKSFTITETENQDKAGEWKFQIASTKATGFFKISLQTY